MKTFISLALILFSSVYSFQLEKKYTINAFVNALKKNGTYDLFVDIRDHFGNEVSIETCYQIYANSDCEPVVLRYMPQKGKKLLSFINIPSAKNLKKLANYFVLVQLFKKYKKKLKIKIDSNKIILALTLKFPDIFSKI